MDNRRDSKNRKDDHASSSLIKYKGREHWPRTKYHLECHFDSHGLQGLIIKGKAHRPAGGFITTHINPVTMSVIRDAAAADNTNEGTVVASRSPRTQRVGALDAGTVVHGSLQPLLG